MTSQQLIDVEQAILDAHPNAATGLDFQLSTIQGTVRMANMARLYSGEELIDQYRITMHLLGTVFSPVNYKIP